MNPRRQFSRLLLAALTILVMLVAVGAALAWQQHRRMLHRWRTAEGGLRQFAPGGPSEIAAELKQVQREVQAAEERLARHALETDDSGPAVAPLAEPAAPQLDRAGAYFELVRQGERLAAAARAAGVTHAADESFGFSSYRHTGPELPLIPQVETQRRLIEQCLTLLWATGPAQFRGIQRTRPILPDGRPSVDGASVDFFVPRGRLTRTATAAENARAPAVRLQFEGRTQQLRDLIERVGRARPALWIEAVEVEAIRSSGPAPGTLPAATVTAGTAFPMTALFTVTLRPGDASPRPLLPAQVASALP